jgi:hypothetical protein
MVDNRVDRSGKVWCTAKEEHQSLMVDGRCSMDGNFVYETLFRSGAK